MSLFVHDVKNFVSESEIAQLKDKVHSLKSDWKPISEYDRYEGYRNFLQDKDRIQHILGDAIYLIHTKGQDGRREEINWELRNKLVNTFDWLYDRLFQKIKETFKVEKVEFDRTLPVPGFHVFGKHEIENAQYIVHQDSGILDYYPDIDENNIRSFVLLIESPETPPYLDIVMGDKSEKVFYEYGTLHFWHGMIPHRIGPFSLKKGEYRITFQGHFYVDPNSEVVKLYF
jgi:hypothetical protein